jgi:glutaredoxin
MHGRVAGRSRSILTKGSMLVVGVMLLAGGLARVEAQGTEVVTPDIVLFTHVTCPYCTEAKRYVEELQRRTPGLTVWVRELSQDRRAGPDLEALARQVGVRSVSVPAWVIGGEVFLLGFGGAGTTGRQVERILEELGLPRARAPGARSPR